MFLNNTYIIMAIAHIFLYWKSLYDHQGPSYHFLEIALGKILVSRFSRKLSVLAPMLLHNTYINMTISHILVYRNCLYDLRTPI